MKIERIIIEQIREQIRAEREMSLQQIRSDRERSLHAAAEATEKAFLHFVREGVAKEPSPWSVHKPEPEPASWWTSELARWGVGSILFLSGFAWLLFN